MSPSCDERVVAVAPPQNASPSHCDERSHVDLRGVGKSWAGPRSLSRPKTLRITPFCKIRVASSCHRRPPCNSKTRDPLRLFPLGPKKMRQRASKPALRSVRRMEGSSELLVHPSRYNLFRRVGSGRIDRPNEGNDFPKVVRGFHGETHLRHSRMHGAILDAFKTRFFQVRREQSHDPEQHIVSITPEPDALSQRRAEAAAASAAMTFVAARQPEIFDELVLLRKLGVILIGTMQVP